MSLIPDYANAVGSAMSYNRKAADTKGKEKTDGNASSEKTVKANKADKTDGKVDRWDFGYAERIVMMKFWLY